MKRCALITLAATLITSLACGVEKPAKADDLNATPQQIIAFVDSAKGSIKSSKLNENIVYADFIIINKVLHPIGKVNWPTYILTMGVAGKMRLSRLRTEVTVTDDAASDASTAGTSGMKDRSFQIETLADHSPLLTVRSQKSLPFLHGRKHGPIPVKLTAKLPLKLAVQTPDGPATLTITSLGNGDATVSARPLP